MRIFFPRLHVTETGRREYLHQSFHASELFISLMFLYLQEWKVAASILAKEMKVMKTTAALPFVFFTSFNTMLPVLLLCKTHLLFDLLW
jgi:hypothetical protein